MVCALSARTPNLLAQEAIFTPAATQPSAGHIVTKHQFSVYSFDSDPTGQGRHGTDVEVTNELLYGVTGDLSLSVSVAAISRYASSDADDADEAGFGDASLSLKHRFWQNDFGPVNTARASAFIGAELPTGTDAFSSDSVDPFIGAVFMLISGRHGFNQAVTWKMTTGDQADPTRAGDSLADLIRTDTAYLFRIAPDEYTADYRASLYATLELTGLFETNGDRQLFLAPGILYEATTYALEAGVQIPVDQHLDERPEAKFALTLGIRFLF